MLNILLVDSRFINNEVIKADTIEYFKKLNIKCNFYETDSSEEALSIINSSIINIAFIDVNCRTLDGVSLIKTILEMNNSIINTIAVVSLDEKSYRFKTIDLKTDEYIYKPYDYKEIYEVLASICFNLPKDNKNKLEDNTQGDFMDFDDDGFLDFDNTQESVEDNKIDDLINRYNNTHTKISAKEFLENNEDYILDNQELIDLIDDINLTLSSIMFLKLLNNSQIEDIITIFDRLKAFLYNFTEFDELLNVLESLNFFLSEVDIESLDKQELVSRFIIAILGDLDEWIRHLFIEQDSVDICYINASILSNYLQLTDIADIHK